MDKPHLQIKFFRTKAGLTQTELAAFLGVDVMTVINFESGKQTPTMEELIKLAHICHTSTDELLGFSPDNGTLEIL